MDNFAEKVWFVTGASAGLGRALAERIVERGGRVVATARNKADVNDLAALDEARVATAELDVADSRKVDSAVALAEQRFGRIDTLVNCAGYALLSAMEEASDNEIQAQFEVNFFGAIRVMRAALPLMRRQKSGLIINYSSLAGARSFPGSSLYCATKWALEGLSEGLAQEIRSFGIGVLIVQPGPFRTDFSGRSIGNPASPIAAYSDAAEKRLRSRSNHGRQMGDPRRAADLVIDAALDPNRPLRLLLGSTTLDQAQEALRERLADMERSRAVAPGADFPS